MISETAFFDCAGLPPEMSGRFDQPWHFVGEIMRGMRLVDVVDVPCRRCTDRFFPVTYLTMPEILDRPIPYVCLRGHLFITDDMIEVVVYFGVCGECDAVHWARQGPPFKRARCLVTA